MVSIFVMALTTDPIKHKKIMCIVKKYNNKKEVIKDVAKT